jgi:rubrerythrin
MAMTDTQILKNYLESVKKEVELLLNRILDEEEISFFCSECGLELLGVVPEKCPHCFFPIVQGRC